MKNKKGFTLIELLAVIVILGLLMAIAVPSITRYVMESRKNTMTTTINNYINSMINEVNDLEYTFNKANTIYAVPIECIAVERGGRNPFGEWHQANDSYWAYVLIQFDAERSTYRYGFAYKDSAGYGLYPISQSKFKEIDKHIRTGLNLKRPQTGKVDTLTPIENWSNSGFEVNATTNLNVLVSEREGIKGNGLTTCTLYQKADNYNEVEAEKDRIEALKKVYALVLDNSEDELDNKPMIFVKTLEEPKVNGTYNSQKYGELPILAVYTDFLDKVYEYGGTPTPWSDVAPTITSVVVEDIIQPECTSAWFANFVKTHRINVTNLDVSKVTSMAYMFYIVGNAVDVDAFNIVGMEDWDVSNVTDMTGMFSGTGTVAQTWSIGDVTRWDVSNVKSMQGMFASAAYRVDEWKLNLTGWNLQSLTDTSYMFAHAARLSSKVTFVGLNTWDTSNITDMTQMFYYAGYNASYILNISNWNVSNVTKYGNFKYKAEKKIMSPVFK